MKKQEVRDEEVLGNYRRNFGSQKKA